MNNTPTTVNLDLGTLLDADPLILAAETEDDIGCILRLHLQVEQTLDFYLNRKRTADIAPFVRNLATSAESCLFLSLWACLYPLHSNGALSSPH
ncbi:hypothetical protein AB3X91_40140 [Paraburkholderia sp. BR14263]|uniref:Uncharacterized protein n=1 Tax=Paraburkholderia ferrariae TaxID=386056 RepID=A0ABU9S201_9BURK